MLPRLRAYVRAQIEPEWDVRMSAALRMPRAGIGVTKMLQACEGMIQTARPFEAAFVANRLPADFLARFTSVRNALEQALGARRVRHGRGRTAGSCGVAPSPPTRARTGLDPVARTACSYIRARARFTTARGSSSR